MRRLIIFKLSWQWAVCSLALVGVIGIALTVLGGSAASSGRLGASSGGITTVQETNGQAGAGAKPVVARRTLRKVQGKKPVWIYQTQIGSNPLSTVPMGIVDGVPLDIYKGNPHIFEWEEGETHLIEAPSPVPFGPGHQYVFTSWSDGGAQSHSITIGIGTPYLILANYKMQYLLTMSVNQPIRGSVLPSDGWYFQGALVTITATAKAGYVFGSWIGTGNGSYQGNINPHGITMNDPITETATFVVPSPTAITITSNPAGTGYMTVNDHDEPTPKTYNWLPGSPQRLTAASPVPCGAGCRYFFTSWSDGNASAIREITVPSSPTTYTANYQKQFLLTMKVSSQVGSVKPGTSWHNSGATVPLSASGKLSEPRYDFLSWTGTGSGSYTGTTNHVSVTMNGPITETANFKRNPGKADSPTGGPKPN
jgi:Divergent InlB B-repeat domain